MVLNPSIGPLRQLFLFLALSLGTITIVHAQGANNVFAANTRPAIYEDMPGVWEMTFQRFSRPPANDPQLTARYQIFSFQDNGFMKNITATRRVTDEDRALFLDIMPEDTRWEMPQDGLLVIRHSELDADGVQVFRVVDGFEDKILSGSPPLKRGDLVLIYKDKEGVPYLRRYLRLIPLEQ